MKMNYILLSIIFSILLVVIIGIWIYTTSSNQNSSNQNSSIPKSSNQNSSNQNSSIPKSYSQNLVSKVNQNIIDIANTSDDTPLKVGSSTVSVASHINGSLSIQQTIIEESIDKMTEKAKEMLNEVTEMLNKEANTGYLQNINKGGRTVVYTDVKTLNKNLKIFDEKLFRVSLFQRGMTDLDKHLSSFQDELSGYQTKLNDINTKISSFYNP